jgi:hypothetical protein
MGSASAGRQLTGPSTTRLKSVNFDHEMMEIGKICSNFIEKSHHSSNPEQIPG